MVLLLLDLTPGNQWGEHFRRRLLSTCPPHTLLCRFLGALSAALLGVSLTTNSPSLLGDVERSRAPSRRHVRRVGVLLLGFLSLDHN